MKRNLMRMWHSGIAMVLALCMIIGFAPVVAFAQEEPAIEMTQGDLVAAAEEIVALVEEYYDEAFAYAYQYAEENGYIDEAIAIIEDVIAAAEEIDTEAVIAELTAQLEILEKELAEKKAELEAAVGELKAEVAEAIEKLNNKIAQIKAAIAEIKQAVAEIREAIQDLKNAVKMVKENIEAGIECAKAAVNKVAEAIEGLEEWVAAIPELVAAQLEAAVAEVKALLNDWYNSALSGEYTIAADSHYVALGDSTAAGKSYVNLVAQELAQIAEADYSFTNLAQEGLLIQNAGEVIAKNAAEIAASDLVTIGFGSNSFATFMVEQAVKLTRGETVEFDWAEYVGEEGLVYVEELKAAMYEELVANGVSGELMGADLTDLMMVAAESCAYSYIAYAFNLPQIMNDIHELNPDALIVVVGMYNPLANVVVDVNGEKLAIGEYMQYLVDAANAAALGFVMLNCDAVYVDAPAVQTVNEKTEMTVLQFVMEYVNNKAAKLNPSEAGHAYIAEQILNALTVDLEKEEEEIPVMWGDVNGDGRVNHNDARLIMQYYVKITDDLNLEVADVNGDGTVNHNDARLILQHYVGIITVFPVEE